LKREDFQKVNQLHEWLKSGRFYWEGRGVVDENLLRAYCRCLGHTLSRPPKISEGLHKEILDAIQCDIAQYPGDGRMEICCSRPAKVIQKTHKNSQRLVIMALITLTILICKIGYSAGKILAPWLAQFL
jgi:hypothetical protein